MTTKYDPHHLLHCGNVETSESDDKWTAVCSQCGRSIEADSADELVESWYRLKSEKGFGEDLEVALGLLVEYLVENDGEISSKKLLSIGGTAGRRALTILDHTELVVSRYEIEVNADAPLDEAVETHKNGGEVNVFCRSNFKLLDEQ